jgi:heme oxygenase
MLRTALREYTRLHHERIEKRLAIEDRVRARETYIELLDRFYAYYAPIEVRLARHDAAFREHDFDIAQRWKTSKLECDLARLGGRLLAQAELECLPDLGSFPRAVGCLYVLEGATLGGQVILRQARAELGIDAASGASFFAGYGPRNGAMWQAFLAFLGALHFDAHETNHAIAAACETFECLERWMCEPTGPSESEARRDVEAAFRSDVDALPQARDVVLVG